MSNHHTLDCGKLLPLSFLAPPQFFQEGTCQRAFKKEVRTRDSYAREMKAAMNLRTPNEDRTSVGSSPPLRQATTRSHLFVLLLATTLLPSIASAAAPALTHLFPAGGQRGTKVVVTCAGNTAAWPVSVFAPGVDVVVGQEAAKLEVTIPADLAADRVWIRLHNAEGASAAVPFLIGNVREIEEVEPNNAPTNAQAIAETPVTINGALANADVDDFAVTLTAGQTLVASLDAFSKLGSPMDAILQVVTPDGIVLAENHDAVDLDPRLVFTATKPGPHIVRVFAFPSAPDSSVAFHGGANYVYRLTLTTGPFVTHSIPLTVSLAEPGSVTLFGWNLPPDSQAVVVPFGGELLASAVELETQADLRNVSDSRLGFAFHTNFAGAARVRLVSHPVITGLASMDAHNPTVLTPPSAVTGRLPAPRQTAVFRVPLKKGQQLVAVVEARGLDFPLDPVLKLTDPTGKIAVNVDTPAPSRAEVLTHAASQDGDYQLSVRDRHRRGSDRSFFRLTARLEEPDFELTTAADALIVNPDKPTEFIINVVRRTPPGVTVGPITIEAVDLPPGITAAALISEPTGPTATKVTLSLSTTGPAFSGQLRIRGTAALPLALQRLARTPPKLNMSFDSVWLTVIAKPQ